MALTKCKECSHEVSTEAKICPNCGAKVKKPVGLGGWILIAILGFIVYQCTTSLDKVNTSPNATANSGSSAGEPTRPLGWTYREDHDKLTSKTIRFAFAKSTNTFDLKFPYQGGTRGTITIRQHPRYGRNIIFSVNKGQILCTSYDGCTVTVRFDQRPLIRVHADGPSDHDSTTLFLSGYDSLLTNIRKSKKMTVEVEFSQQGIHPFEFDVANLNWK